MEQKQVKTVTPTELRTNIYRLLDEVLQTGVPIEIRRGDRRLRIEPVEKPDKFLNLVYAARCNHGRP